MIRLVRITGFLLIGLGALVILTWLIEPLREVWPALLELPFPVRVGLSMAAVGLLILMGSLIWERYEDRENDRSLREDDA